MLKVQPTVDIPSHNTVLDVKEGLNQPHIDTADRYHGKIEDKVQTSNDKIQNVNEAKQEHSKHTIPHTITQTDDQTADKDKDGLIDTYLISSPYPFHPHLLDLAALTTPESLLAQALTVMTNIRSDYSTAPYPESFNWDTIISKLRTLVSIHLFLPPSLTSPHRR